MLTAVDLDRNASRKAREVEKVSPERGLPADMEATLPQALESAPQDDLRVAHGPAKSAGAWNRGAHQIMMFHICSDRNHPSRACGRLPHPDRCAVCPSPLREGR